jgi:MFS family permease
VSTSNLFTSGLFAIYVPYVIDQFGFDALRIGIVGSIAALGSIVGALISSRVSARLGVGTAIVVGAIVFGAPTLGIYLASTTDAIPVLAASFAIEGFGAFCTTSARLATDRRSCRDDYRVV